MSGGRRYDEHGEVDDRNYPVDRADHPVWRLLSAQVIDRSGLWLHGQSPPAKPLPDPTRGVLVILSLLCQLFVDQAQMPISIAWLVRAGVPLSAILLPIV